MFSVECTPAAINSTDVGRIGENYVAYLLERSGIGCSIVDRRGSDIWCKTPSGLFFQLEVKTATAPSNRGEGKKSYSYQVKNREADWFAFMALDREIVIFKPPVVLPAYVTYRIETTEFNLDESKQSLDTMLKGVKRI